MLHFFLKLIRAYSVGGFEKQNFHFALTCFVVTKFENTFEDFGRKSEFLQTHFLACSAAEKAMFPSQKISQSYSQPKNTRIFGPEIKIFFSPKKQQFFGPKNLKTLTVNRNFCKPIFQPAALQEKQYFQAKKYHSLTPSPKIQGYLGGK